MLLHLYVLCGRVEAVQDTTQTTKGGAKDAGAALEDFRFIRVIGKGSFGKVISIQDSRRELCYLNPVLFDVIGCMK